jgi:hypothetical protein
LRSIEKIDNGATMRGRDRDGLELALGKPVLHTVIDLERALTINPERDAMIRKRKNGRMNRASSGTPPLQTVKFERR